VTVRFLALDELRPEHELGVVQLRQIAFGEAYGTDVLRQWKALGFPLASYTALYAVDGAQVLAGVEVHRPWFTTPEGTSRVGGLAYVSTRPMASRQGHAGRLIQEVLERQRAEGDPWVILWTSRSNGAHGLYEQLGFSDVGDLPRAFRLVPKGTAPPEGFVVRRARPEDLAALDELRNAMARGRTGFVRREPGHLARFTKTHLLSIEDIVVLEEAGRPAAYGLLQKNFEGFGMGAWESVAPEERLRGPLLQALESEAAGRWLTAAVSPFSWWHPAMRERGYAIARDSFGVLMACPLGEPVPVRQRATRLGTDREAFISQTTDHF
jgi:GNAT superfamily N-acetyltransferase